MRSSTIIIGLLLVAPHSVIANDDSLYERMQKITLQEYYTNSKVEPVVKRFVKNAMPAKWKVVEEDVNRAVRQDVNSLCAGKSYDPYPLTWNDCDALTSEITSIANGTNWIRALGRDLQIIASSYELGIDGYPGRKINVATRMPSIIKIWQSDTDKLQSPIIETQLRGASFPDTVTNGSGPLADLRASLRGLQNNDTLNDGEEFTAAVWRYRHGFESILYYNGACDPSNSLGDGTELQTLRMRWCDVENALEAILQEIQQMTFDPPLTRNEHVIFPIYTFPDLNVSVWASQKDVGLQWGLPLEPVLPSLDCSNSSAAPPECVNGAILGGKYPDPPPEPGLNEGICSHFFGQRGYLCRSIRSSDCRESTDIGGGSSSDDEPNTITLTSCEPQLFDSYVADTTFGTDICEIGGWRTDPYISTVPDTPEKQDGSDGSPAIEPNECSNCAVDIYCADNCGRGTRLAITNPKNDNGVIEICIPNELGEAGFADYVLIHELVHAQQLCGQPPGQNTFDTMFTGTEQCCANEREAYHAQCAALAEDGVLPTLGIDIEVCSSILSNNSCAPTDRVGNITSMICTPSVSVDELNTINAMIFQFTETYANELGVNLSCEDAINNMDGRAKKMINSLPMICSPECQATYENTIGNNLCYIGQCIEQSIEHERIIPGRMAIVSQDQSFEKDSDVKPDPVIGEILTIPRRPSTRFPPYTPKWLMEQMDLAICQTNGLPAKTPPVLCAFENSRAFDAPKGLDIATAQSLLDQQVEYAEPAFNTQKLSQGIATKIGTELYANYLLYPGRTLAELIENANTILSGISNVRLPSQMCPRGFE